jgi:hypothetical protein
MRVINRTAISVVGARPYVEWTERTDMDFDKGTLTVARSRLHGTTVLLPEFELEEDVDEWVEENAEWLFEMQLSAWTEDESRWPPDRDLRLFRQWFRVDIHTVVVDAGNDDIDGEEL